MSQIYSGVPLEQIDGNQGGNYLTSNVADDEVAGISTGLVEDEITTADIDYTTDDAALAKARYHYYFRFSGTMDDVHNVIVPAEAKQYSVENGADHDITVKTPSGTGITVAAGTKAKLYCDGVDVIEDAGGGAGVDTDDASTVTYTPADNTDWNSSADPGNVDDALDQLASRVETLEGAPGGGDASTVTYTPADNTDWNSSADPGNVDDALDQLASRTKDLESGQPYDVGATFLGAPFGSAVILRYPMPRAVVFPAGMTNSQAVCGTAPSADATFSIQKNGAEFATVTIASGATSGTFASASGATFAAGDVLTIVAPSSEDSSLSDVGITLAGTR